MIARNEAKELGFKVLKTSTLIKRAEMFNFISSYSDIIDELEKDLSTEILAMLLMDKRFKLISLRLLLHLGVWLRIMRGGLVNSLNQTIKNSLISKFIVN